MSLVRSDPTITSNINHKSLLPNVSRWVTNECVFPTNEKYHGCQQDSAKKVLYLAAIAYSGLILLTSIGFLWYRIILKGQSLYFPSSRGKGIIRPRPLEAFQLCVVAYSFLTIENAICLLYQIYPDTRWALVGSHIPYVTAFSLGTLYPIGLVYALSSANSISRFENSYLLNKHWIDVVAGVFLLGPGATILPFRWLKGSYLMKEDLKLARQMAFWNTGLWILWTILYLIMMIFFWYKMNSVLSPYIAKLRRRSALGDLTRLRKILQVSFHMRIVVIIMTILYGSKTIFNLFKNLFRSETQSSLIFELADMFLPMVLIQLEQMVILYNIHNQRGNVLDSSFFSSVRSKPNDITTKIEQTTVYIDQLPPDTTLVSAPNSRATMHHDEHLPPTRNYEHRNPYINFQKQPQAPFPAHLKLTAISSRSSSILNSYFYPENEIFDFSYYFSRISTISRQQSVSFVLPGRNEPEVISNINIASHCTI